MPDDPLAGEKDGQEWPTGRCTARRLPVRSRPAPVSVPGIARERWPRSPGHPGEGRSWPTCPGLQQRWPRTGSRLLCLGRARSRE